MTDCLTRADKPADVTIKVGGRSVVVHGGLRIGGFTLAEHQVRAAATKPGMLTRSEAIRVGHRPAEVEAWFGPLAAREPPGPELMVPKADVKVRLDGIALARAQGYTGDSCADCGSLSMVRNGTCLKCENCGSTTGCS